MLNTLLILSGQLFSFISRVLNLGSGSTWPGHIAIEINKNFAAQLIAHNPKLKIVLIAGTNGKTTTGKLIRTILEEDGKKVFQNEAGANLLNGIASSILLHSNILCDIPYDYAVFEVDENSLPLILNELTPDYLILMNLFRDQLDRYGEVNTIAGKWKKAIEKLPSKTNLILNADDPQIARLGSISHSGKHSISRINSIYSEQTDSGQARMTTYYFGLDDPKLNQKTPQHAVDSTYCPNCKHKLTYKTVYFSHLGDWKCPNCKHIRPKLDTDSSKAYPLPGIYNMYNTHAALLFAKLNNINNSTIQQSLKNFSPAFGRQEIIKVDGKKIQLFLSKNPTSFNQSLQTVAKLKGKNILLVLNDRIPDGRDVSWIWDTDTELLNNVNHITISGDRAYDMGLRIKYGIENQKLKIKDQNDNLKFKIYENLKEAIQVAINEIQLNETFYILPTYSAMLEVRKILTGRGIL